MTPESLVRGIHDQCFETAIAETEAILLTPPGRSPTARLLQLSNWFIELDEAERTRVMEVARFAAHGATFGVLAALDGSRKVVDSGELRLTDESGQLLAGGDSATELHDLFQAEVGDWLTT